MTLSIFASTSEKSIDLGGDAVVIRKLTNGQFKTLMQMQRDKVEGQDDFLLTHGVKAWPGGRANDEVAREDLDPESREQLVLAVLKFTRPSWFEEPAQAAAAAEAAQKETNGPAPSPRG